MNKAYKVIYNETTSTYVAVAEIATSHTKSDVTIDPCCQFRTVKLGRF